MKECRWFFLIALLMTLGCDSPSPEIHETSVLEFPDLQLSGKGDSGSSNVSLGPALERGNARNGLVSGYLALPVSLNAQEPFLVQAWTDQPSVVFVYGPNKNGSWNFEQVREFSKSVKPGVETQWFQFQPTETGDYLVIVGALSGEMTRWIVAWADEKSSF